MKNDANEIEELKIIYNNFKEKYEIPNEHRDFFQKIEEFLKRKDRIGTLYETKKYIEDNDYDIEKEKLRNMIKNLKNNFKKNIFDLDKIFYDLENYNFILDERVYSLNKKYKKFFQNEVINDFLADIIFLKRKVWNSDDIFLFYICRDRMTRKMNESKNLFVEINKRSKGLDCTPLIEMLFNYTTNIDSIRDGIEKYKGEAIKYHKNILDILIYTKNKKAKDERIIKYEKLSQFFTEIKKRYIDIESELFYKKSAFYNSKKKIKDILESVRLLNMKKENILSTTEKRKENFLYLERNKILSYFYLETYLLINVNKKVEYTEPQGSETVLRKKFLQKISYYFFAKKIKLKKEYKKLFYKNEKEILNKIIKFIFF